jgi:hypothetical protein
MITLSFCLGDNARVIRCWLRVPRIGDTIALPELGGNLKHLKVFDVIWEGSDALSISVYVYKTVLKRRSETDQSDSRQEFPQVH